MTTMKRRARLGQVRKAVIPVAGLGTRFLPATKAMPKEMLTLVDKPLIQYTVEEAVASGIEEIILITGEGTEPIVQHFARKPALERELRRRGKAAEARLGGGGGWGGSHSPCSCPTT